MFSGRICYVSLHFNAKQNLQLYGDAFFYKNIKEAKERLPELMSPPKTRMNGREMSSRTSAKQTNARAQRNWTNGCSKVQTVDRRPNNQWELKQKRQQRQEQRRLKNDFIFILWISQKFRLIQFVYHNQINQN